MVEHRLVVVGEGVSFGVGLGVGGGEGAVVGDGWGAGDREGHYVFGICCTR